MYKLQQFNGQTNIHFVALGEWQMFLYHVLPRHSSDKQCKHEEIHKNKSIHINLHIPINTARLHTDGLFQDKVLYCERMLNQDIDMKSAYMTCIPDKPHAFSPTGCLMISTSSNELRVLIKYQARVYTLLQDWCQTFYIHGNRFMALSDVGMI